MGGYVAETCCYRTSERTFKSACAELGKAVTDTARVGPIGIKWAAGAIRVCRTLNNRARILVGKARATCTGVDWRRRRRRRRRLIVRSTRSVRVVWPSDHERRRRRRRWRRRVGVVRPTGSVRVVWTADYKGWVGVGVGPIGPVGPVGIKWSAGPIGVCRAVNNRPRVFVGAALFSGPETRRWLSLQVRVRPVGIVRATGSVRVVWTTNHEGRSGVGVGPTGPETRRRLSLQVRVMARWDRSGHRERTGRLDHQPRRSEWCWCWAYRAEVAAERMARPQVWAAESRPQFAAFVGPCQAEVAAERMARPQVWAAESRPQFAAFVGPCQAEVAAERMARLESQIWVAESRPQFVVFADLSAPAPAKSAGEGTGYGTTRRRGLRRQWQRCID